MPERITFGVFFFHRWKCARKITQQSLNSFDIELERSDKCLLRFLTVQMNVRAQLAARPMTNFPSKSRGLTPSRDESSSKRKLHQVDLRVCTKCEEDT